MQEEFSVQMANEVQNIDYRKSIQDTLQQQQDSQAKIVTQIGDKIDNIAEAINTPEVDLTEVTDMLNELDTNTIVAQNEDIIMLVQEQQDAINTIESKINLTDITNMVSEIDTNTIQEQNNNIVNIIQQQQEKIESIESKLDLILEKLE